MRCPSAIATDLPDLFVRFAATDCYRRVRKTWDVISVTAIIVDRRGWFLVQHRDDKPDIVNPGLWGSFGGWIEPYETPEAGFLREMEEELVVAAEDVGDVRRGAVHAAVGAAGRDRPNRQLIYVYAAPLDVPYRQLELREGQGMALFPLDGLPETTVAAYLALLRRFAATDMYRAMTSASS